MSKKVGAFLVGFLVFIIAMKIVIFATNFIGMAIFGSSQRAYDDISATANILGVVVAAILFNLTYKQQVKGK